MEKEHPPASPEERLANIENFVEPFKALGSLAGELEGYNKAFRVILVAVIIAVTWVVNDQNYKRAETDFRVEQVKYNSSMETKVRALEDAQILLKRELAYLKDKK